MASEETAQPAVSAPAASGGGGKLVTILTLVNLIATLAMVAVLFITFQRDKKKPAVEDIATRTEASAPAEGAKGEHGEAKAGEGKEGAAKESSEFGKMVTLDQFTVNLSTPGSVTPKFVRVNVSLQVPSTDVENEVNSKMPQVRNAIIDLFNSKRPADLANAEGRDYLKEEIKNALNGFMVNGKVQGVFFTNFAVSS
jgi:flagellar FliL protein